MPARVEELRTVLETKGANHTAEPSSEESRLAAGALVGKFTPTTPNDSQWLPMAPNDSRQLPTTTNTRCCCLAPP